MIGQNLGIIERLIRLCLGLGLGAWSLTRPDFGVVGGVALLAACFLVMNSFFGRCYLWALFKFNTCEPRDKNRGRRASDF